MQRLGGNQLSGIQKAGVIGVMLFHAAAAGVVAALFYYILGVHSGDKVQMIYFISLVGSIVFHLKNETYQAFVGKVLGWGISAAILVTIAVVVGQVSMRLLGDWATVPGLIAGAILAAIWLKKASKTGKKIQAEQMEAGRKWQDYQQATGRTDADGQHMRGAQIAPAEWVSERTKGESGETAGSIGGVPIPARLEPYHFMLSGGTGSGKSQAFFELVRHARERGQRGIVVDVGGEFLKRFWKPGDTILNPTDARSAAWSPLAEMRGAWDADKIAKSIVPDGVGAEKEWTHYAQVFISAILRRMSEAGDRRASEFVRLCTVGSNEELAALVEGLPAASLFNPGAEKMLASVRGIVGTYLSPYAYLAESEDGFSVKEWMQGEGDSWLFLTVRDDQLSTLKPLIACWVDVAISSLLSMEPDPDRRVWFLLDEFASLGRIQSVEALLTKARKQGGVGVLGIQSVAQLRETYGQHMSQTLMSCLGTWAVLRAPDQETAEYMSKYLGEEEVLRVLNNEGYSNGGQQSSSSEGQSEQVATRRLVMPSQLQSLPDLQGYLNLIGDYPVCRIVVPVSNLPRNRAEGFIEAERFKH